MSCNRRIPRPFLCPFWPGQRHVAQLNSVPGFDTGSKRRCPLNQRTPSDTLNDGRVDLFVQYAPDQHILRPF